MTLIGVSLISCYHLLNSLLCISHSWFTSVIRFSLGILVWDRFCCSMSSNSSESPGWGFLACRKIWERHSPHHSAVRCQPRNGSFWSTISSSAILPQGLASHVNASGFLPACMSLLWCVFVCLLWVSVGVLVCWGCWQFCPAFAWICLRTRQA